MAPIAEWVIHHRAGGRPIEPSDLAALIETLSPASPERAMTLRSLRDTPTGDPRLASAIEQLLEDDTVVLLDVEPLRYGPIRWLAATVLAAERAAVGVNSALDLADVPVPLTGPQVRAVASAEGDPDAATADVIALARRHAGSTVWPVARFIGEPDDGSGDPAMLAALEAASTPTQPAPIQSAPDIASLFDPGRHALPPDPSDVRWRLDELRSSDARVVADALPLPPEMATRVPVVKEAIRGLLDDRRLVVHELPDGPAVVEMRWLAAHALAWELRATGERDAVVVADVRPPMAVEDAHETAVTEPLVLEPGATLSPVAHDVVAALASREDSPSPALGHHLLMLETGGYDDARIVPLLRQLLDDERVLVGWLPTCAGEVRWFAALALAGVLRASGRPKDVTVHDVPAPLPCSVAARDDPTGDACGAVFTARRDAGELPRGELKIMAARRLHFAQRR